MTGATFLNEAVRRQRGSTKQSAFGTAVSAVVGRQR